MGCGLAKMLPKRCNRGAVSNMKGERVPKDRGIVTERFD